MGHSLMVVFLVAVIGYLIGSIKIKGIEIGTAGVLLVALVFGHFGYSVPKEIQEMGLILFVTSVGFIAGPKFFRNFKVNAKNYILLGFIIILAGALTTVAIIKITGVPTDIAVGMMSGALTSTPGLPACACNRFGNHPRKDYNSASRRSEVLTRHIGRSPDCRPYLRSFRTHRKLKLKG